MSAVQRRIFHLKIPNSAAEYTLSTLIQRFAVTVFHHLPQKAPDCSYAFHQIVEFREFYL